MTTYIYRVTWIDEGEKEVLYPTKEPAFAEAIRVYENGNGDALSIELLESTTTSLGQSPFMPVLTWLVDEDGVIY